MKIRISKKLLKKSPFCCNFSILAAASSVLVGVYSHIRLPRPSLPRPVRGRGALRALAASNGARSKLRNFATKRTFSTVSKLGFPILIGALVITPYISSEAVLITDEMLVKAEDDYRVYYIANGKKRWVESIEALEAQGFHWRDVQIVGASDLARYEEGDRVTVESVIVFSGEGAHLPDLTPFPPYNVYIANENGRDILRFATDFWNQGKAPLDLSGYQHIHVIDGKEHTDVYQRLTSADGEERRKYVGLFEWHSGYGHNHYHYTNFADYILESVDRQPPLVRKSEKISFCFWDIGPVNLDLPGAPTSKVFDQCNNRYRQGLSIGWKDIYKANLQGQFIDIQDLPAGIYRLTFHVNPKNKLIEEQTDNNVSVLLLDLDVAKNRIEIIASGAPFPGSSSYKDDLLIGADGDSKIYVIHNNKRRLLRNETILASWGRSRSEIRILPQNVIEAIPLQNLVRADGISVYALNDAGYRRHIHDARVFDSYELSWDDVADISSTEFASYPDSRLVRVFGENTLYVIDGKTLRPIDPYTAFHVSNYSWDEVHVINAEDFATYSTIDITP